MNRSEFVSVLSERAEVTKKDADKVLTAFMDTIKETLAAGNKVAITGFMTFEAVDVEERNARNPKTGETVVSSAHKKIKVKIGSGLKAAVNA